jgi:tRNA modification GTPase
VASPALPTTPRPDPDTIAAVATAPGRGGIGVIRVSGQALQAFARQLAGKAEGWLPQPRLATLASFRDAAGQAIDHGLLLYFPAPHSFTGEDVLELQGHGGPVVLQMLLSRCLDLGARLAEPGEFTRRSFLNGKLDLAQAEAVADLIDASTAAAARGALRSLDGEFSREINRLLEQLIELRALTEATLDFPDEEIDFLKAADAFGRLDRLQARLRLVFERAHQGRLLQGGLQVVLVGQPNVGKSSLLNRLAGDDLAIVTPHAGTTRDALKSSIQIEGVPLHVIDTAGLRDTDDEVEKIGIARTWREIERADVILLLADARSGVGEAEQAVLARLPERLPRVTVLNKIDLLDQQPAIEQGVDGPIVRLSAKSGSGLDDLRRVLLDVVGGHPAEDAFVARERHLRALTAAQEHIGAAQEQLPALELFAEELRMAQHALAEITGEYSADDLLGDIFGRFCIGK